MGRARDAGPRPELFRVYRFDEIDIPRRRCARALRLAALSFEPCRISAGAIADPDAGRTSLPRGPSSPRR